MNAQFEREVAELAKAYIEDSDCQHTKLVRAMREADTRANREIAALKAGLVTERARLNAVEQFLLSKHRAEGPGDEPKVWLGHGYFTTLRAAADAAIRQNQP